MKCHPLFASQDVDAQMHKRRKKLRTLRKQFATSAKDARNASFFERFLPDVVTLKNSRFSPPLTRVPREDIATDVLARESACWALAPDARWHRFRDAARRSVAFDEGVASGALCELHAAAPWRREACLLS